MRVSQSTPGPPTPASRCSMTSLSEEEESPTPRSSSSRRSCGALIRLPLWARASGPSIVSMTWGWALRSRCEPVVE